MKHNSDSLAHRIQKNASFISAALLMIPIFTVFTPTLNLSTPLAAPQVLAQSTDARKTEADRLLNQGIEQFKISQFSAALQSWQQALTLYREIKDRQGEGNALGNLGNAYYSLGNYAKAIEYLQQHLAIALARSPKRDRFAPQSIAREIKDRLGEGSSLNNLGLALYKQGNLAAAEKNLLDGIKVWESLRNSSGNDANKVSIFETQTRTYVTLQQVLIAQNKTDAALEIAERGRARAFVELLATRISITK